MSANILQRLSDETIVALCVPGDDWPRSLLSATLIPDKWMALLERADGRRRFVPSGEDPRPQRDEQLLLVRNRPLVVPLAVQGVVSADDHETDATCELLVRWEARADDLAGLKHALLEAGVVTLDGLARRVQNAGGLAALRSFIRSRPAAELVHEDVSSDLFAQLSGQLKRFTFAAGLTLERLLTARFSSPTLAGQERLQRETAARVAQVESRAVLEQAAAAATQRRLGHVRELLEKIQGATQAGAALQWHELLPALTPVERGKLLESLWRVTPDRRTSVAVAVVVGNECLWLDPATPERIARRLSLEQRYGGLRSISFDEQRGALLIGAARGVWQVSAADGTVTKGFAVTSDELPRTGFNAAAIAGEQLYASHSQLGVWSWPLDGADATEQIFKPIAGVPRAIRAVTATADGCILFAADDTVHLLRPSEESQELMPAAPGEIQCLAVEGHTIYAGTAAGDLVSTHVDRPASWTVVHRAAAPFESIQPRRWTDLLELVVPAGSGGVCGIYTQEGVVARLMDTPVPVRRAWAADDLLVALSEHRDRLIVMRPDAPERSGREVALGRLLGHSVQDACIITQPVTTPATA